MAVKSRKTTVVLLLAGAATVGAGDVWQTSVSAGRSESARAAVVEDLDAPVATARYREPSAQALADAGLAPAPVSAPTDVIRLDVPAAAPDGNNTSVSRALNEAAPSIASEFSAANRGAAR